MKLRRMITADRQNCVLTNAVTWRLVGQAAILAVTLAGCDWPGRPDPKDRLVPNELKTDFKSLYKENCAACHGKDGNLGPAPPLNDPIFLAIVPDAELLNVITAGTGYTVPAAQLGLQPSTL